MVRGVTMRIVLVAGGSRGDVQPIVALAQGLVRAGHAARVTASAEFAPLAEAQGVELWPVAGDVHSMMESDEAKAMLRSGNR